jgi:AraC-like DNA-binding protein
VGRARSLLLRGWPAARVALETGFADQSHLIRRFKRLVGVTPGRYAERSKNVQYDDASVGYLQGEDRRERSAGWSVRGTRTGQLLTGRPSET